MKHTLNKVLFIILLNLTSFLFKKIRVSQLYTWYWTYQFVQFHCRIKSINLRKPKKLFDWLVWEIKTWHILSFVELMSGSKVHICFFLSEVPLAFILNPNVSAVRYRNLELMRPMVQHPRCWFWVMMSHPLKSPLLCPFKPFILSNFFGSTEIQKQTTRERHRSRVMAFCGMRGDGKTLWDIGMQFQSILPESVMVNEHIIVYECE